MSSIDGASMSFLQNATISDNDVIMLTALGEALVVETGVVGQALLDAVARNSGWRARFIPCNDRKVVAASRGRSDPGAARRSPTTCMRRAA